MSKPIFTWSPDIGARRTIKATVHQAKFGDGYEQRIGSGVNFKPRSWSCQFSNGLANAQSILAFLDARGGLESFTWTDPMNETNNFVCREWSQVQQVFGVYQVTATFEQVFEF
jgi:phage-related protein